MKRLVSIACMTAALACGASASAQNAAQQAEARTLFNEGARLYTAGSYPEACAKLEASYHLYAGIGTRGKLAECYEKVGRTASAWAMYEEVAALAGKTGDATRVRFATDRAAALEPALAHLTIVLPPASDVPGLVLKRGGEPVERGAIGSAVAVDPGTLSFEVSAPGFVTQTVDQPVPAGQSVTFSVPTLSRAPEAPVAATEPPSAPAAAPAVSEEPAPAAWRRPAAIAVAGAGAAAIVVGAVVALTAKSSYSGAFDSGACSHATLTCTSAGQDTTDSARTRADVGGVVMGVGAALVVGG
ncbi:MAG TPA: hypothetical protein VHV30_10300, partial [Polyangiaceae bacterium]|nr:hypothetical protein [Polyangiaceae bacterium]